MVVGLAGCRRLPAAAAPPPIAAAPSEVRVVPLPLAGEAARRKAEYSGLAWYDDNLILLPQYPARFGNNLWVIPKTQIIAFLDGQRKTLEPRKLAFVDDGLPRSIAGFEGYEALAFAGETAYLTIESDPGSMMACYLVRGHIAPDLSVLTLDAATRQEIPHPVEIDNMCVEAMLVFTEQVLTFFEANGANINPHPEVHFFDARPLLQATSSLPNIEYRLTDVSAPDAAGRFWAINSMFPGDAGKLSPATDALATEFETGASYGESGIIERLIEIAITPDGIVLTETAPIRLQLLPEVARNWEGLVRLDDRGFLLVTDKFPETMLAFVPFP